jgi:hypothetical protein
MNEILFRGKTLPVFSHWDDEQMKEIYTPGEWIYGGIGITYYCTEIMTEGFMRHINYGGSRWMDEEIEAIRVVPETVGQYIGKNDITDKKIFTGDIVNIGDDNEKYYEVFYNKEECAYQLKYFAGYITGIYDNMKVVGNVTDNPELYNEIGRE